MLYHVFFKNSLAGSMEYRANFLMAILVECAFLLIKLLYVIVSYQMDLRVNGLTPDSILLFVGTYTFITGIMSLIYFPNFLKIPYYVQDGTLDIYLTKPVSLQFMISFRYIDFGWAIPNIFGGIAMIAIAFVKLDLQLRIGQILGFILYNFLRIRYCFFQNCWHFGLLRHNGLDRLSMLYGTLIICQCIFMGDH